MSEVQIQQLSDYFGLLAKWNRKINLTGLEVDPATDEAIDRLLVEPVQAAKYLRAADHRVVDLGSGGGSPAVPLKIAAPGLRLVMVEVKARKSAFLRDVVRHLAFQDVEVANARFEELLTRVDLHESADVVTLRAVRADQKLWAAAQAFLRPGGRVLWFGSSEQPRPQVLPPLTLDAVHSLVPATRSQLTVLLKQH